MRKVELLPTRDCEAGYGPAFNSNFKIQWHCQYQKKKKKKKKRMFRQNHIKHKQMKRGGSRGTATFF